MANNRRAMKQKFQPIEELRSWVQEVRGRNLLLARSLGVKSPTVSDWVSGKKGVPWEKCMPIERATSAAVTRRHLRPDDYLVHWPELAQPTAPAQPAPWDGTERRQPEQGAQAGQPGAADESNPAADGAQQGAQQQGA